MKEDGISSISLDGIGRIGLSTDVRVNLLKENKEQFYAWMENNGHGGLISSYVQPMTLKSFAKEFDFEIYKGGREETLKFGSRFTNKILSQGTYSWFMGILGSSNNIIYPAFYEDKIWHDPTLYEPTGWHCLYYRN